MHALLVKENKCSGSMAIHVILHQGITMKSTDTQTLRAAHPNKSLQLPMQMLQLSKNSQMTCASSRDLRSKIILV